MRQSGTLGVRVFASRAQLPVEGAAVVITQKGRNGKYRVLSLQETDRNGSIVPVTVPTPDTAQSTSPNSNLTQPFARCDIWVEHGGYEVMAIEDVQVFPGQMSLQEVELNPLVRGEAWTERTEVRPIPAQTL
ncbi:MAG: spore cortex-lytic protein [Ruminococcaceae bacterium]|nr:spore cortex-lytic protein [Oscillospiraceae bacterium]